MTYIDEVRIQASIATNKLKTKIAQFLVDMASKFDQEVIKRAAIGLKVRLDIQKYIPQDGLWHQFAMTVEAYVRRDKKTNKKEKKVVKTVFIDGVKTSKRTRRTK